MCELPCAIHLSPNPEDLLGDWTDHIEDDCTVRVFDAHFNAELFKDMG